ncbi:glutathione S-transferase 1-like [Bradysia coprophila]|uniref:glutathione S-transferase 1-like n=1 Tax=Bradysia coprophila TaxID=38358 RepID=UPI00187DADAE|nr:glutathione S-transferase 1-like [Bradysia coprophila]
MGKVKLYYADGGPASRAVILAVKALNLDVEYILTDSHAGQNKTAEYIKMNPQSTVPTLDDNGKIVWDSHAITRYLASAYGTSGSLFPNDPYQRAVIDQRLHFDDGVLMTRFGKAAGPVFRGLAKEYNKDDLESLYAALDILEIFLSTGPYVAGSSLTVADFSLISTVTTIDKFIGQLDAGRFPKVVGWIETMKKLPYFEEANTKPLDKMYQGLKARMG